MGGLFLGIPEEQNKSLPKEQNTAVGLQPAVVKHSEKTSTWPPSLQKLSDYLCSQLFVIGVSVAKGVTDLRHWASESHIV
jgi:hypothetical protein